MNKQIFLKHHLVATVLAVFCLSFVAGCATDGTARAADSPLAMVAVQYGTLKLVENSQTVSADDVVRFIGTVRTIIDSNAQINMASLFTEVGSLIDYQSMPASDRLLVSALITQVQLSINDVSLGPGESSVVASRFLDWIETAARMAAPPG